MDEPRKILPILNALPVFEQAARLESFTKAAQVLGMAQPSVSRFIANLEDHLGVRLFQRDHSRITLTPEGLQFYEAIQLGLGHIRGAIENLDTGRDENTMTLLCTHGFAQMWILPRRAELQSFFPDYEILLEPTETAQCTTQKRHEIGFYLGEQDWGNLETHLLFEETVFPVCSPAFASHHQLSNDDLTIETLRDLPLLVENKGETGWVHWQLFFEHFGHAFEYPKGGYISRNYALTLQAAMESKGVALAWEGLVDQYLNNNWLVKLDRLKIHSSTGYYVAFSPDNPVADGIRRWVETLRIKQPPPSFG